ncbi:MAG: adenylate/guanylate cyclase domain-containing protein [Gammaproteobacteria bacterium]|nr:adenylate/guanylate cyclase domain-containing protein [Gammaproteobacteria bacterium]
MRNYISRLKREIPLFGLALLVMAFFLSHAANLFEWRLLDRLEGFAYDARIRLTMPNTVDPRIVIVDIDDKSLREQGHWPWRRDLLEELVDTLFDHYQVALAGFDATFPEPDDSSGLGVLEQLGDEQFRDIPAYAERLGGLREILDYDRRFADSLRDRPVILGYYFTVGGAKEAAVQAGALPPPVFPEGTFEGWDFFPLEAKGYGANLPQLTANAFGNGHFTMLPDEDGIVRRVPMLIQYQDAYYEALSLAMLRYLFVVDELKAEFIESAGDYRTPERIAVGPVQIPIDERSQVLVPYRGRQGSFPYVSATDVLNRRAASETLRDTIVIVGTSAQGLADLRSTPVQNALPGVEVHANILSGVLDQRLIKRPLYVLGVELAQLFVTGLALALMLPFLSAVGAVAASAMALAAYTGFNLYLWQVQHLVIPLASGLLMIMAIFLLHMSYGFFIERRGKRQLSELFGQYIPPELVEEMSVAPESYSLEAQSRELTVLFSDIRGFTTISEGLTPADLSALMKEYLTAMTKVIHEHRGTIDKYIGDAIMAFWGAPLEDRDHAPHAIQTALYMLERLNAIREDFHERGWPEIRIGIGINTGVMSVGDMGSRFRRSYTVLGDAVNLGSRLEGLTKEYGVEMIVSESTVAAAPEHVYRELDLVRVKGKHKPIAIYEPVAESGDVTSDETEELEWLSQALRAYRGQEWDAAASIFIRLQESTLDRKLYGIYLERIAHFKESPPGSDWDGVFTHLKK